jgi:Na+-transporting methylmalonyl-CoA/oxaloacetate decarboxylase gamma subunit
LKTKRNLLEVGISLFIFGLSMVFFPSIFETASVHNQLEADGFIIGCLLIIAGVSLVFIKWYMIKNKSKQENK